MPRLRRFYTAHFLSLFTPSFEESSRLPWCQAPEARHPLAQPVRARSKSREIMSTVGAPPSQNIFRIKRDSVFLLSLEGSEVEGPLLSTLDGRPWLWPASRKFTLSSPWISRTPLHAWPPASFPLWKLCEFTRISAASALNPASGNSLSAALRIPSSIASAPTASSSPPSPTLLNLDKLLTPHVPSADAGHEGWVVPTRHSSLATVFSRHPPAPHSRWSAMWLRAGHPPVFFL
jgi:hypothetical protein